MSLVHKTLLSHKDLLHLHANYPQVFPFLLQSVAKGKQNTRFDILFAFPQQSLSLNTLDQLHSPWEMSSQHFLNEFNQWFKKEKIDSIATELPFHGGWFVYLGYELAQQIEPRLQLPLKKQSLPIAFATRIPAAIITDHVKQTTTLVCELAYAKYLPQLERYYHEIDNAAFTATSKVCCEITEEDSAIYQRNIDKVIDYIVEGDVFQVNLSRLWQIKLAVDLSAAEIYALLRESNPAPFSGSMHWKNHYVISSSPERLIKVKNQIADIRPIAGTRPRGRNKIGGIQNKIDLELKKELFQHPKERAEHVMLIDLGRNDLGRICQPGSISVDEFMSLESYSHVHHIVSNITGKIRAEILPGDILAAVFPGGTITGCPKVRCMEIIAELEQQMRQAYTGSMGFINRNGDMDFNILIRTLIKHKKNITLRAGGGIVKDSIVENEINETRAKAKGLLQAFK